MNPLLSEFLPIEPPYALIGKLVVESILACVVIITVAVALILWYRGWKRVSRWMWHGDETPPVWRVRIAGVAEAFAVFKFHRIPAVLAEAPTLTENDTTLRQSLRKRLQND